MRCLRMRENIGIPAVLINGRDGVQLAPHNALFQYVLDTIIMYLTSMGKDNQLTNESNRANLYTNDH